MRPLAVKFGGGRGSLVFLLVLWLLPPSTDEAGEGYTVVVVSQSKHCLQ